MRKAIVILGLFGLMACTTTRPLRPEADAVAKLRPGTVLEIERDSGETYLVRYDEVRGDTLLGYTKTRNVRQPLAEVRSLAVRRHSVGKTIGLIGGLAGAYVTSAFVLYLMMGGGG